MRSIGRYEYSESFGYGAIERVGDKLLLMFFVFRED
jgi:hypothetical protein